MTRRLAAIRRHGWLAGLLLAGVLCAAGVDPLSLAFDVPLP